MMKITFILLLLISFQSAFSQKKCFEEANHYRFDAWLNDSTKSNLPFDSLTAHIRRSQQMLVNCQFPNDTLTTITGKHLSLHKFKGKVLIIDFWSVYCIPCVNAIPSLHGLLKKYDKKLNILAVTLDSKESVVKFLTKHSFDAEIVADARSFFEKYSLGSGYPLTLLVDTKGRIRYFRSGVSVEEENPLDLFKEFDPLIDKLLK